MYERFTDRLRNVMKLANQEANRLNHEYIGTEHLILGLCKDSGGVTDNIFRTLGISTIQVAAEVERIAVPGPYSIAAGKYPHTPRAKNVIGHAIEQAKSLNHNYVGTEHLLFGLIIEREGIAAQVLKNFGLTIDVAHEARDVLCSGLLHAMTCDVGHSIEVRDWSMEDSKFHYTTTRIQCDPIKIQSWILQVHNAAKESDEVRIAQ